MSFVSTKPPSGGRLWAQRSDRSSRSDATLVAGVDFQSRQRVFWNLTGENREIGVSFSVSSVCSRSSCGGQLVYPGKLLVWRQGFADGLRQVLTEFGDEFAQCRGDHLGFSMGRRASSQALCLAAFRRRVGIGSAKPPLSNETSLPTGVHVKLLDIDGYSREWTVAPRTRSVIGFHEQQSREVCGERSLECLVEPLGPLRVLKIFDFICAGAKRHRTPQEIGRHFDETNFDRQMFGGSWRVRADWRENKMADWNG